MFRCILLLWTLLRPHFAPQLRLFIWAVFLTACATACSLTASWLLKGLIDVPRPGGDMTAFVLSVLTVAGVYFAAFAFWAAQQTIAAMVTEEIFVDVKARLLAQLLEKPRNFFDTVSDADMCSRLTFNLRRAALTFRDDVVAGLFEIVFILGIVTTITVAHWKIGLGVSGGLAVYIYVVLKIDKPWLRRAALAKIASSQQENVFLDILRAARDIRVFNLGSRIQQHFAVVTQRYADTQIVLSRFSATLKNSFALAGAWVVLFLVAVNGALIIWQDSPQDVRLTSGELVVMFTILMILLNTLNQILTRAGRLIDSEPWIAGVATLMTSSVIPSAGEQPFSPHAAIPDVPSIDFINVSYSRSASAPLIRNFTLHIAAGEKVALMGATGSGKSMLLDLLMRLREPGEGQILFSGIDARTIESALFYSAFGFVGQQSHLMQMSLKEFLLQGWPGQADSALWRVLDLLKMADVVRSLPKQLDTDVGFQGWSFSSGQRQRLAVARALLRDPQILVLDEFTAMLDTQDELELVRDVLAESKRRTVICTTYSTAVSALFERVVVL